MKLFIVCTVLAVSLGNFASAAPTVDDKVYEDLAAKGTATVILHFKGPKTSELLAKFREEHRPSERSVHHDVLPNLLEANANKHQATTLELLKSRKLSKSSGSDHFQLWVLNQLAVHDVDHELLEEFQKSNEITRVEANKEYQLISSPVGPAPVNSPLPVSDPIIFDGSISQSDPQWGVKEVGAPEVWGKGYTGKGVVVGVIDTGVRATHQILRKNYRSAYGWFDAVSKWSSAYDDQGHGSHCAGTILGSNGYGVAPDATLIACKALNFMGGGSDVSLRTCGQFMMCPTDAAGNAKDCASKPKIISNSWGGGQGQNWYNDIVDNWIANGQIAIFANGNDGPGCSTAGSPGDYEFSIAVGATNISSKVAKFSSRGPNKDGKIKPDISAPGENIKSAGFWWDSQYATMSGTSMAAPHIAGVAALYCQQNNTLTQKDVLEKLVTGAKTVTPQGETCGDISDTEYPNNSVGRGIAYAPAAFNTPVTTTTASP